MARANSIISAVKNPNSAICDWYLLLESGFFTIFRHSPGVSRSTESAKSVMLKAERRF
jgi:hypothetical protein